MRARVEVVEARGGPAAARAVAAGESAGAIAVAGGSRAVVGLVVVTGRDGARVLSYLSPAARTAPAPTAVTEATAMAQRTRNGSPRGAEAAAVGEAEAAAVGEAEAAGEGWDPALERGDWARVERYSLFEHTVRTALCAHLDAARQRGAALTLSKWEDLLRQRQAYAVAEVWRTVGRFLLASGAGQEGGARDWGTFAWRRLYLTEVAPWADYAEGDEYRYLGLPVPPQ